VCVEGGVQLKADFRLKQSKMVEERDGNHHGMRMRCWCARDCVFEVWVCGCVSLSFCSPCLWFAHWRPVLAETLVLFWAPTPQNGDQKRLARWMFVETAEGRSVGGVGMGVCECE
jgi:hypothetical protein